MRLTLQILYYLVLVTSTILALRAGRELYKNRLGIIVPFLLYVLVQEVSLHFLALTKSIPKNDIVYNFYRLLSVFVFMMIYARVPFMHNLRKLIYGSGIGYFILTLLNYLLFESVYDASIYLPILRGILITFYGVLFLFNFFQLDDLDLERQWRPLLWITIGVVVFYPVTSIVLNLQPYLRTQTATIGGIKLYNLIPQFVSVFMYGCFSYAFLICRKHR